MNLKIKKKYALVSIVPLPPFIKIYRRISKIRERREEHREPLEWNCELHVVMAIEETVNF